MSDSTCDSKAKVPLFLRVDWECKDQDSVDAILGALKVFVDIQIKTPYKGVLTYHFTRPDPNNRPMFIQYMELYSDLATFWAHAQDTPFLEAYKEAFLPPEKHKSATIPSTVYAYGPLLADSTIKATTDYMQSKYPGKTAGFLINETPDFETGSDDPGPVMLLLKFIAKEMKGNIDNVTQVFRELICMDSNRAIMFHVTQPERDTQPNAFEIVACYAGNSVLVRHLGSEEAQKSLKRLVYLSAGIEGNVYGSVGEGVKNVFSDALFPCYVGTTDVGYVLHPQAKDVFA